MEKTKLLSFTLPTRQLKSWLTTNLDSSGKLAVVLPGAAYSIRLPLLYFAIQVLLSKGFDVLSIETLYGDDMTWKNLPSQSQARDIVEQDSIEFFKQLSNLFPNQIHTVLARSLGTYSLASALEFDIVQPKQIIWQNPSLGTKWHVMGDCKIRSLGISGTDCLLHETALKYFPKDRIVIDGADHAMEATGAPLRTIEILQEVTTATSNWLDK